MIHVVCVVGARPNFMKAAPLISRMKSVPDFEATLVHTGQHYDERMSKIFFEELGLPRPDVNLNVGSTTAVRQIARIMERFEEVLLWKRPDLVLVVGDVTSTLAAALTARKMEVPLAHVEAGLRSFDGRMPEEINRVLTDRISDYLFATERSAVENLQREGIPGERIHLVGNLMIDSLLSHLHQAERSGVVNSLGLNREGYALLTVHRPGNVDSPAVLSNLLSILSEIHRDLKVVFPIHPRTRGKLREFGLSDGLASLDGVIVCEPLGYLDFLRLMKEARIVLTDSGGIQEETTVLGIPCLTLRENTERPVTVTEGSNRLVGLDPDRVVGAIREILRGERKIGKVPPLWDGQAASRILEVLAKHPPRSSKRAAPVNNGAGVDVESPKASAQG